MKIIDLKAAPKHIDQLARWHHEEWAHLNPGDTLQKRMLRMQAYLSQDFIPSTYVALTADQLTGSAAIVESDMDSHPEYSPWLASVYVDAAYRKRGIGAALVKHVMQQAREQGLKAIYLYTPSEEAFYKTLGWNTLSKESYHGSDVTIMRAELSD